MVHQLRTAWVVAALLAVALLAATVTAATTEAVPRADDDDPAGVCVHLRAVDPHNEYCLWLTTAT